MVTVVSNEALFFSALVWGKGVSLRLWQIVIGHFTIIQCKHIPHVQFRANPIGSETDGYNLQRLRCTRKIAVVISNLHPIRNPSPRPPPPPPCYEGTG